MDFEEVYRAYFHDVYVFSLALTADAVLAEEITQETFFKALRAIDRFDGAKDIRAWLFTIARNSFLTHRKKAHRVTGLDEEERSPEPPLEELLTDEDTAFHIHQFLHQMKEPYKEVFSLRTFGELSFEKIGALFGKNAGWARVTYYRAKRQIQEYMEAIGHV